MAWAQLQVAVLEPFAEADGAAVDGTPCTAACIVATGAGECSPAGDGR